MKQYIRHFLCLTIAMVMAMPNLVAQVDLQKSFYVMHNDSTGVTGKLEGGEWLIRFSDTDSLGNQFSNPVAMNIEAAYYGDTTYIEMQTVDSVLFEVPEDEMKPGVFELTEDHFKYIIGSDSTTTIRFRIDCLTKVDLPKVGQKVLCNIFRDHLPYGFVGQVESMNASYDLGYIELKCKQIPLKEVYSKYYKAGFSGSDSLNAEAKRRGGFVAPPRRLDPEMRTTNAEQKGGGSIPMNFDFYVIVLDNKKVHIGDSYNNVEKSTGLIYQEGRPKSEIFRTRLYSNGTIGAYWTYVIDEANKTDVTGVWLQVDTHFRIEPSFVYEPKVGGEPLNCDCDLGYLPIPTPIPGLTINCGMGFQLMLRASFEMGFAVNLRPSFNTGYRIVNDEVDWFFESAKPVQLEPFQWDVNGRIGFAGSATVGPFMTLGIGVGGKLADLSGKLLLPRLELNAKMDLEPANFLDPEDWNPPLHTKLSDINFSAEKYKAISDDANIKMTIGPYLTGEITIGNGLIDVDILDVLKGFGINVKQFEFDLFNCPIYPSVKIEKLTQYTDKIVVSLDKSVSLLDVNVGVFLKDMVPPGEEPSIPLWWTDTDFFVSTLQTRDVEIPLSFRLRGKCVRVYPYLQGAVYGVPFTEIYIPGVHEEFYIPFKMSIKDIETNYLNVYVEGKIEECDGLVLADSRKVGIRIYDKEHHYIATKYLTAVDGMVDICGLIDENDTRGLLEGYASVIVDDEENFGGRSESEQKPFKILLPYEPKTLEHADLKLSSVKLQAELSPILVQQVKNGQELNAEVGFHIQEKYSGADSKDILVNAITIPFTDETYWIEVVGLKPGTAYDYYSIVKKEGVIYKGETKSFTTGDIVQELDAIPMRYFSAMLLADIAKSEDFKTTSFHFQISESKDDWTNHIKAYPNDDEWDFGTDGEYYSVSTEVSGLKGNTTYYYRVAWERNSGAIMSMPNTPKEFKTPKKEFVAKASLVKVEGNSATIKGTINADLYDEKPTHLYMVISTDKNFDAENGTTSYYNFTLGKDKFEYEAKFDDLEYKTKYYYQFVADRSMEEILAESDVKSFTTDADPIESQACETLPAWVSDNQVVLSGQMDALTLGLYNSGKYTDAYFGFAVSAKSDMSDAQEVITFDADEYSGLFTYETTALPAGHTYYYKAFLQLTGSTGKIYSTNGPVEFRLEKQDGDLIIPDAKKRQGDLDK